MIKNVQVFLVGLLVLVVGVVVRHQSHLVPENWPALVSDFRLYLAVAFLLFFNSFLFRAPNVKKKSSLARASFQPLPPGRIATALSEMTEQENPDVPLIVDFLVFQALALEASDIHFDPDHRGIAVKYRLEGMVRQVATIPKKMTGQVINRLKILSKLIIYKDATPQDGRFDRQKEAVETPDLVRSGLTYTDFRIAFMPTLHGERVVIRILGDRDDSLDLISLGLDVADLHTLQELLAKPQGMIILTGPTGSGKTTTIYAALQEVLSQSEKHRSIATLEDPIEYNMPDINQSQVDEKRGFGFQNGLRAILRQDPDVIMVGEIRDRETAQIAMQAGMTGHLLITTVHAGSSSATFSRLMEMDIPAYTINSAVTAVIAQRLIRTICPHCKVERGFTEDDLKILKTNVPPAELKLFRGAGCDACGQSGYHGRKAIFEILLVTEPIRRLVSQNADSEEIYQAAVASGMRTLWSAGLAAVSRGETTLEEIERTVVRSL